MTRLFAAVILTSAGFAPALRAQAPACPAPCAQNAPIFIAFYWKARLGKELEYQEYIRRVAEPIDAEAEHAGGFEELRTYLPDQPNGEWTHLRVFRLKDQAQFDAFSAAMDAAGKRAYPDPSKRPKADELRDLVKRETWRGFR